MLEFADGQISKSGTYRPMVIKIPLTYHHLYRRDDGRVGDQIASVCWSESNRLSTRTFQRPFQRISLFRQLRVQRLEMGVELKSKRELKRGIRRLNVWSYKLVVSGACGRFGIVYVPTQSASVSIPSYIGVNNL